MVVLLYLGGRLRATEIVVWIASFLEPEQVAEHSNRMGESEDFFSLLKSSYPLFSVAVSYCSNLQRAFSDLSVLYEWKATQSEHQYYLDNKAILVDVIRLLKPETLAYVLNLCGMDVSIWSEEGAIRSVHDRAGELYLEGIFCDFVKFYLDLLPPAMVPATFASILNFIGPEYALEVVRSTGDADHDNFHQTAQAFLKLLKPEQLPHIFGLILHHQPIIGMRIEDLYCSLDSHLALQILLHASSHCAIELVNCMTDDKKDEILFHTESAQLPSRVLEALRTRDDDTVLEALHRIENEDLLAEW